MKEQEEYYIGTAKVINHRPARRSSNVEHATCGKLLGAKEDQRFTARVSITITSHRTRLADADGLSAKAAIDGLVHSGVLQDDSPQFVEEVKYRQIKVGSVAEEKTVIFIEEVE